MDSSDDSSDDSKCPIKATERQVLDHIISWESEEKFDLWTAPIVGHILIYASGYGSSVIRDKAIEVFKKWVEWFAAKGRDCDEEYVKRHQKILQCIHDNHVKYDNREELKEYIKKLSKV